MRMNCYTKKEEIKFFFVIIVAGWNKGKRKYMFVFREKKGQGKERKKEGIKERKKKEYKKEINKQTNYD